MHVAGSLSLIKFQNFFKFQTILPTYKTLIVPLSNLSNYLIIFIPLLNDVTYKTFHNSIIIIIIIIYINY